jgi:hypothetical protein
VGPDVAQVHANIDREFDAYPFLGWVVDGEVVAMLAIIEPEADWTSEELAEPQTYISRFFVVEHGKRYGRNSSRLYGPEAGGRSVNG